MCCLSDAITDYHFVSQGKTSIPGVDDGEEFVATDVSTTPKIQQLPPFVPVIFSI